MRGTVPGLPVACPLGTFLPAVYQEDDFTMRFTAGMDDILAAAVTALDCVDAYLDPRLAPVDFLRWMAGWVGATLGESWPVERQRAAVLAAVDVHRARGTLAGLRDLLTLVVDGDVEVTDNGGVTWSRTPGSDPPGDDTPWLRVLLRVPDPAAVHREVVEALVSSSKPAHVGHNVEVVPDDRVP